MANQNFTNFTLKIPASGDFLVGYNADSSDEYRTTISHLTNSLSSTFIQSNTTLIPTATAISNIVMITQANYDALAVRYPNTIYFIVDNG